MGCDGYIHDKKVTVILECYDCQEELGRMEIDVSEHFDHGMDFNGPCVRFSIDGDGQFEFR